MELYYHSLRDFANFLKKFQKTLDFHMSARGWCYALEPYGLHKADFDWGNDQINGARLRGYLPPGFILEEEGHAVETFPDPDESKTPEDFVEDEYQRWQEARESFEGCDYYYDNDQVSFWNGKPYFIQVLVEKSDLKSLFRDICTQYRISIANMRGWGSMEQKAAMAARFSEMELSGHAPVLLVCGDFDPPGLSISSVLKEQFEDYKHFTGWNPENLIVERIGLSFEFIREKGLTWIDGLGTGQGKDLSDPHHPFYQRNTYDIQGYIKKYGKRKCEANAVVVVPELGRRMLLDAITRYLGADAYDDYEAEIASRRVEVRRLVRDRLET
jgi:hypothetical protein